MCVGPGVMRDPQGLLIAADIEHMNTRRLVVSIVSVGCLLGSLAGMSSGAHAVAMCSDGWLSFSEGSGTCSDHGGVAAVKPRPIQITNATIFRRPCGVNDAFGCCLLSCCTSPSLLVVSCQETHSRARRAPLTSYADHSPRYARDNVSGHHS
jgi:hypothetical protein